MSELPASRQLLNITKAALDHCEAECERLRAELKSAQAVCDSYAKENQQFHDEIEWLRAAAELARKRLLDVVRNGDGEPEDVEALEVLDRALKDRSMYYCSKCWRRPCECFDQLECSCGWKGSAARALSGLSFKYCPKCGEQFAAAIRALKDKP